MPTRRAARWWSSWPSRPAGRARSRTRATASSSAPLPYHADRGPFDGRIEHDVRLTDPHFDPLDGKALEQRRRESRCKRLEQPVAATVGHLADTRDDVPVVDRVLNPIGGAGLAH